MIPLQHGLILAAILFVLGLTGLVIRRNLLFMLIGLEIMINASRAGLCGRRKLLGPDRRSGDVHSRHQPRGGEASIGLALLLQLHRRRQNLNIDSGRVRCADEHACLNHYFLPLIGFVLLAFSRGRWSENVSAIVGVGSVGWRRW